MARRVAIEVKTPVDLPSVPYATSTRCVLCHPQRYETWHRTFHRTMTQRAGPESVLGDFDHASLTYDGIPTPRATISRASPRPSMLIRNSRV